MILKRPDLTLSRDATSAIVEEKKIGPVAEYGRMMVVWQARLGSSCPWLARTSMSRWVGTSCRNPPASLHQSSVHAHTIATTRVQSQQPEQNRAVLLGSPGCMAPISTSLNVLIHASAFSLPPPPPSRNKIHILSRSQTLVRGGETGCFGHDHR